MDHTFVDEKSLKSLEDYAVTLASAMLSLGTLCKFEKRAIEIGILKEDQAERANVIFHHLGKLIQIYNVQIDSVFELLPENFNAKATIQKLQATELTKARSMIRKTKDKENAVRNI